MLVRAVPPLAPEHVPDSRDLVEARPAPNGVRLGAVRAPLTACSSPGADEVSDRVFGPTAGASPMRWVAVRAFTFTGVSG